jgi:hypothetical protein
VSLSPSLGKGRAGGSTFVGLPLGISLSLDFLSTCLWNPIRYLWTFVPYSEKCNLGDLSDPHRWGFWMELGLDELIIGTLQRSTRWSVGRGKSHECWSRVGLLFFSVVDELARTWRSNVTATRWRNDVQSPMLRRTLPSAKRSSKFFAVSVSRCYRNPTCTGRIINSSLLTEYRPMWSGLSKIT